MRPSLSVCIVVLLLVPVAFGGVVSLINLKSVTPGDAVAAACAGSEVFGSGNAPGIIYCPGLPGTYSTYVNNETVEAPPGQTATASESNSSTGIFSNHAWASASDGTLKLYAVDQETGYVPFAGSVADAGWNDELTIPGPLNQQGIWKAKILVHGDLKLDLNPNNLPNYTGYSASGDFEVDAWEKVGSGQWGILDSTGGGINQTAETLWYNNNNGGKYGATILSGWTEQLTDFFVKDSNNQWFTYGPPTTLLDLSVNQVLTFYFPFTYNVPFDIGIWADAAASEGSSGAYPQDSMVDFSKTMTWDGSLVLPADGTGNGSSNFTVQSTSGFNYLLPATTPEPGSFGLAALAFLAAAWSRKRLRRL